MAITHPSVMAAGGIMAITTTQSTAASAMAFLFLTDACGSTGCNKEGVGMEGLGAAGARFRDSGASPGMILFLLSA